MSAIEPSTFAAGRAGESASAGAISNAALSICIPTFNRAGTVHRLVLKILKCPAADIEVVVLDNGSTDDTIDRLAGIRDERLCVHSNGTNRGVLFNTVNVLLKARGDFCVLLLDKDDVAPEQIGNFKDFLARADVACGFCEYDSSPGRPADLFAKGFDALSRVAYTCHHPTGYFFKRALLRELDIGTRFVDPDYVGHFCFEFVFAELSLLGTGAIYHRPIFAPETLAGAAKPKSFGTNASREDAFFSPSGRLKMAINFSHQIGKLPISRREKRRLIADRFMHGLRAATVGYKSVMASPELCSHYHVGHREVHRTELWAIGVRFYREFALAVVASNGATAWVSHARFVLDLCARNGRRLIGRLTRRA